MRHLNIYKAPVLLNLIDFNMKGDPVKQQSRSILNIAKLFLDQDAVKKIPAQTMIYMVQFWMPVAEGTAGGLFFGTTMIMPGKVGSEYLMTKGHYHSKSDRAEFYWGVQGKGMLIMMDRERNTWAEMVYPGSLHYISSEIAHRLANTGFDKLIVGACWPSDAGHNYSEIEDTGFSARLLEKDGNPVLVSV